VALRVFSDEEGGGDRFEVQGRGELHLGVLIETMRREGFELSISPPVVLYKNDEKGRRQEPMEELVAEVEEDHAGGIIEAISLRKGELTDMVGHVRCGP
jgi:GTP-binding protein